MFNRKKNKYQQMTASELLDCYWSQNEERAFEELYGRYKNKLSGFFFALLSNFKKHQIDDLIQQTYLNLIASSTFKHNEIIKFDDYLIITARNTFLQFTRKTKAQSNILRSLTEKDIEKATTETDASLVNDRFVLLEAALEKLPTENQKMAMQLKYRGKSYREIAVAMNVQENKVKDYLYRGKINLKKIAK